MSIYAYKGVPSQTLSQTHSTTLGQPYTLNYNQSMVQTTRFKGQGKSTANAQGWERNSRHFFKQHSQQNPQMYSRENQMRIANNQSPVVDRQMIRHVPEYAQYNGEKLVHHHIGGDGQAVALPESMHTGSGGVHNHEKAAGITQNCKDFSFKCQQELNKDPSLYNTTADAFHSQLNGQQNAANQQLKNSNLQQSKPAQTPQTQQRKPAQASQSQQNRPAQTRSAAARNSSSTAQKTSSGGQSRSATARNSSSTTQKTSSGQSRSATARSSSSSGQSSSSGRSSSSGSRQTK